MANYRAGNAFASSFMQGFSFVDTALANRRREAMLAERLEEEKKTREFNRTMAAQQNARAAASAQRQETTFRQNLEKQELLDESNAALAERGFDDLTDEEIARYATVNPRIQAEIDKDRAMARRVAAVREAQGIAQQGLSEAAAGANAPVEAANEASESAISLFEPAMGLQEASLDEVRQVSPEFEQATPPPTGPTTSNKFGGPLGLSTPNESYTTRAGTVQFPADRYFSPDEIAAIEDPAEKQRAMESTEEVVREAQARARRPDANQLRGPVTRVVAGAEGMAGTIQQEINNIVADYDAFINEPRDSKFFQLAAQQPDAAAQHYFKTRNTAASVNPGIVQQVDKQMVPVLDRYEAQLSEQAAALPAGSPEQRRYQNSLANVRKSRATIASNQPRAAQLAGIQGGLRLGDTQRIGNLNAVVDDPTRPTYPLATRPASQTRGAMTQAGRISPSTKRLSDRQIESLVVMKDEGLIDSATFQTVVMTGAWPPGKDPNAIKSISAENGYAYALTEGGGFYIIPELSRRVTNPEQFQADTGDGERDTLTTDKLDDILTGAKTDTPDMTPEHEGSLKGFMLDFAPQLRKSLYLDTQENRMLLGRMWMQSERLARESQNDGILGFFGKKDRTAEELFFSPGMRSEYAKHYDQRPVVVPERLMQQPWDYEQIRSELLSSGVLQGKLSDDQINNLSENDLAWIAVVLYGDPDSFGEE